MKKYSYFVDDMNWNDDLLPFYHGTPTEEQFEEFNNHLERFLTQVK